MGDPAQREKILSRIQKLMTLGCDGAATEAEAASAMAFAQKLMVEHQIEMADVNGYEAATEEYVEEEVFSCGPTVPKHWNYAGSLIVHHFFCKVIRPQTQKRVNGRVVGVVASKLCLFGTRDNVAMARHVLTYLDASFPRLWLKAKKEQQLAECDRRIFYHGIHNGFSAKLNAERAAAAPQSSRVSTALALVTSKLDEAARKAYPDSEPTRHRLAQGSRSAYQAGYQEGQQLNVRRSVEAAHSSARPALPGGGA